jgi:hypothetical protein
MRDPRESLTFQAVKRALAAGLMRVSSHARLEAEADRLTVQQIESSTASGEHIEDYPTDPRGPSCLVLGRLRGDSAIHALWGFDAVSQEAILITVYRPDPHLWSPDYRRRSTRDEDE